MWEADLASGALSHWVSPQVASWAGCPPPPPSDPSALLFWCRLDTDIGNFLKVWKTLPPSSASISELRDDTDPGPPESLQNVEEVREEQEEEERQDEEQREEQEMQKPAEEEDRRAHV